MPISKKVSSYLSQASWIRKLFEEGQQMRMDGKGPVYDFSIGNPDLEPPRKFRDVLRRIAADETPGQHKYMSNVGYLETRKAVGVSLSEEVGLEFTPEQIIMTVGAGGAINAALKALIDPGDEVVTITPFFVEYKFYIDNHGGKMVLAKADAEFQLDPGAIDSVITNRTRVVLINNPNNPTGVVYSQKNLDDLGAMLEERSRGRDRPIILIDDAPYRKLFYDGDVCPSIFRSYPHSLMGTSHSKDLGLPGERIGFLAISPKCRNWSRVAEAAAFTNRTLGFVNAPGLMQRVVAELQGETIDLEWYRRKRDLLYNELTGMGYELPHPKGAFYAFPRAPNGDDLAFIDTLKTLRVLTVPGTGFGCPGYFRICYCVHDQIIEAALPLFEKAIRG